MRARSRHSTACYTVYTVARATLSVCRMRRRSDSGAPRGCQWGRALRCIDICPIYPASAPSPQTVMHHDSGISLDVFNVFDVCGVAGHDHDDNCCRGGLFELSALMQPCSTVLRTNRSPTGHVPCPLHVTTHCNSRVRLGSRAGTRGAAWRLPTVPIQAIAIALIAAQTMRRRQGL